MKNVFLTALTIAVSTLSACSNHIPPDSEGIRQALNERDVQVSNVTVNQCIRHNGVDDSSDPRFDWYECSYTATLDGSTNSYRSVFSSNSDGWHVTR